MDAIHAEGFDAALTLTDHIDHLPDRKRRELARIIEILFAGVEKFQATKLSAKPNGGRILKVILYGSYARGDWVEDRVSGYRSDYDLRRCQKGALVAPPIYSAHQQERPLGGVAHRGQF